MPPGSHLVLSHVYHEDHGSVGQEVTAIYEKAGIPLVFRTLEQITSLFTGFDLLDPGVVSLLQWRPETQPYPPGAVWGLAGVGRLAD